MEDLSNVDLASVLLTIAHAHCGVETDDHAALIEAACRLNDLEE